MNGYTRSIPLKTRLENLLAQVPQEHRNRAAAECACDNPHDFERFLTGYVMRREWLLESVEQPHPAVTAYELEKAMDEGFEDDWCDNGLFDDRPYRPATSDGDLPF